VLIDRGQAVCIEGDVERVRGAGRRQPNGYSANRPKCDGHHTFLSTDPLGMGHTNSVLTNRRYLMIRKIALVATAAAILIGAASATIAKEQPKEPIYFTLATGEM
jgi:hypothetical protein